VNPASRIEAPAESTGERVDRWLWAVRLYKTRALALEACRAGHITCRGQVLKPSRVLRGGEVLTVQQGVVTRTVEVKGIPVGRVGAKLVPTLAHETTPPEAWEAARTRRLEHFLARERGAGRPTKRERRQMERWREA
jgi:ribosome-associated heat shock protein Hsp15